MNRTVNTVAALLAVLVAGSAQGQAFPSKTPRDVVAGTPEGLGRFMKEVDRWTTVVNKGGIKPD